MTVMVRLGEILGIIGGLALLCWVGWTMLKLRYRTWRAERALRKSK